MSRTVHSDDEVVRLGQALYEERIRSKLSTDDRGKFLAVDIETGDYALDKDELQALKRAQARNREAVLYLLRVGSSTTYHLYAAGLPPEPYGPFRRSGLQSPRPAPQKGSFLS